MIRHYSVIKWRIPQTS